MSEHERNNCGLERGRTRPCYLYLAVDDLGLSWLFGGSFRTGPPRQLQGDRVFQAPMKERRVKFCRKQAEDARLAIEESIDIQARAFRACHSFRQFPNS
jgi:hypothetical protein